MGTCTTCGVEMKDNAKFCKKCGAGSAQAAQLDRKKERIMSQEKTWVKPAAIAAAVVVLAGALWLAKGVYMSKQMGGHPMFAPHRDASARFTNAVLIKEQGGKVVIPLTTLEDGKAHFYALAAGGKTITFFLIKATDGSIRTAYDACMACNHAKLGYRQEGGLVVCNNCGMGFDPTEIGKVTGGCNPIPVDKSMDGQMIVLKTKDLEAGAQYF